MGHEEEGNEEAINARTCLFFFFAMVVAVQKQVQPRGQSTHVRTAESNRIMTAVMQQSMPFRDPVLVHAQDSSPSPRRRRSVSTASMRSRSARSPSPIVTFTPTPLLSDRKGVKNITRTVIRTLEGLGHLDSANMEERHPKPDERDGTSQLEQVFNNAHQRNVHTANGTVLIPDDRSRTQANETPRKIDLEIPRKLLHSSIGRYLLAISPEPLYTICGRILHNLPLHLRRQYPDGCSYSLDSTRCYRSR